MFISQSAVSLKQKSDVTMTLLFVHRKVRLADRVSQLFQSVIRRTEPDQTRTRITQIGLGILLEAIGPRSGVSPTCKL